MYFFCSQMRRPPTSTLFSLHDALPISIPGVGTATASRYTARIISVKETPPKLRNARKVLKARVHARPLLLFGCRDRKSTRLNSSHSQISYAVFCLKKKISSQEFPPESL